VTSPAEDRPLDGRVALVTGAGRGIGRAIALRLAREGAFVVVNDIDREPADAVAAEIRAAGGHACARVVSVVDYEGVRAMVRALIDELGQVDVLVSNAGVATSGKSVLRTPIAEAEQIMAVNAFAALVLCQEVIESMRAVGRGDIVVISSSAAAHLPPKSGSYNMAKIALEALAHTIAKEEAAHGIRANIVAPGMTDTRLGREVKGRIVRATTGAAPDPDRLVAGMDSPDDVADAVYAFVSDPDPARTGQRIAVS
jgi:NAD(P)-dependent dehydrogenase (short-subunit alcohol dehydrogenase family)